MVGKRKAPFGGSNKHRGQFGRGGKRAAAPTHDVMPTESQYGGDQDAVGSTPAPSMPMRGGRMPGMDFDSDGM